MGVAARIVRALRPRRDPVAVARALGVSVGDDCRFISTSTTTFGSEPYLIRVGDHVTITEGVRFITHDGGVWVLRGEHPALDVIAPITVGSNVFIGLGSIILPGVTIGDDVVIGAGSVVNKDIPARSVAAGVPARVLKPLDDYEKDSLERGIQTKGLGPEAKRAALLKRFPLWGRA